MPLPDAVQPVVDAYLAAVDVEAPGLIEGLYLTGSTALGDFRPRTSDIDYVAVTATEPDTSALAALGRAHARLRSRCPRPFFDGRYVTWTALARDPRLAAPGPFSYEGRFHPSGRGDCDPVAWQTIADHGVACRQRPSAPLTVWTDREALAAWTLANFDSYWQPLLRSARHGLDRWRLISFTSYGAAWIVLGVCRLHFTLSTGQIASKADAGEYGLATFPVQWHRVLNEALRIRRSDRARPDMTSAFVELVRDLRHVSADGSRYSTPAARRREVLACADMVIDDARRRFGA